jgi:MoxR-like ATPase
MAYLEFLTGELAGQEVEIPGDGIVIGRGDEANLLLPDSEVSGLHAALRRADGAWVVTDMESSNGTLVNGESVQTAVLRPGDIIALGETQLRFREADVREVPVAGGAAVPAGAETEGVELVRKMSALTEQIRAEVGKVIVGQRAVLDQVLMCLIAGGHALLIGLPGMAKTLMVSTIARVLDLEFRRVQFTPDLMPTDITGSEILETNRDTGGKEFRFVRGPIFCNLLLADEINRTPPKTQASLLEAMQEKHVTVGNETFTLDTPFFVLATQNPIEQEGTYPLPEAQLDRFMFNIWVDYPEEHEEEQIVGATTAGAPVVPERVLRKEDILQLQSVVREIPVSGHVIKYAIRLVRATRPGLDGAPELTRMYVSTGAGPRAGQYLVLAAKARAVLEGRLHVSCADIRTAAIPVLRHRLLTNFAADSEGLTSMDIVTRLLETVEEPGEETYA